GESVDELDAEIQARKGVSLRGDILGQIAGEGGFAMYFSKPPRFDGKVSLAQQLEYLAYAEIREPDRLRVVLDRLSKDDEALTKTGKKNQWVVDPGGSRAPKLHLLIVGDRLVLASDPKGATGLGSS